MITVNSNVHIAASNLLASNFQKLKKYFWRNVLTLTQYISIINDTIKNEKKKHVELARNVIFISNLLTCFFWTERSVKVQLPGWFTHGIMLI